MVLRRGLQVSWIDMVPTLPCSVVFLLWRGDRHLHQGQAETGTSPQLGPERAVWAPQGYVLTSFYFCLNLQGPQELTMLDLGIGWSNRSWGPWGPRRPWWAWRSPLSGDAHSSSLTRASRGALGTCNGTRVRACREDRESSIVEAAVWALNLL